MLKRCGSYTIVSSSPWLVVEFHGTLRCSATQNSNSQKGITREWLPWFWVECTIFRANCGTVVKPSRQLHPGTNSFADGCKFDFLLHLFSCQNRASFSCHYSFWWRILFQGHAGCRVAGLSQTRRRRGKKKTPPFFSLDAFLSAANQGRVGLGRRPCWLQRDGPSFRRFDHVCIILAVQISDRFFVTCRIKVRRESCRTLICTRWQGFERAQKMDGRGF